MAFSADEQKSMQVLGYLFFRMGLYEKAERVLKALLAMTENNPEDKNVFAILAVIAILNKNGMSALEYLENVFDETMFTGKKVALYLIKAQALWLEQRNSEAKNMLDYYLCLKEND